VDQVGFGRDLKDGRTHFLQVELEDLTHTVEVLLQLDVAADVEQVLDAVELVVLEARVLEGLDYGELVVLG